MKLLVLLGGMKGVVTVGGVMFSRKKKRERERKRQQRQQRRLEARSYPVISNWELKFSTREKEEGTRCLVSLLCSSMETFKFPYRCTLWSDDVKGDGQIVRITKEFMKGEEEAVGGIYVRQMKKQGEGQGRDVAVNMLLSVDTRDGKVYYLDDLGLTPEFRNELIECGLDVLI